MGNLFQVKLSLFIIIVNTCVVNLIMYRQTQKHIHTTRRRKETNNFFLIFFFLYLPVRIVQSSSWHPQVLWEQTSLPQIFFSFSSPSAMEREEKMRKFYYGFKRDREWHEKIEEQTIVERERSSSYWRLEFQVFSTNTRLIGLFC